MTSKKLSEDEVFELFKKSYFDISNTPIGDNLVKKILELTELIYSNIHNGKFEFDVPEKYNSIVGKIIQSSKENFTYLWCFYVKSLYDLKWFPTKDMIYELYQIVENNV